MTHSFPTRRSSDLNVNIGRDVICHQCGNSNAEIDVVAVTQLARGTRSHLVAGPSTRHTSSSRRRVVRFSTRRSLMLDRMTRSEEHTSELQSLMRISYAVFCLKKKKK